MRTMKAAVVPELGAKLEIRELPVPEPGPGQVLIRMQTSGLCHTDIHAAAGDWPVKPNPPFIPGHEGVGIIEEAGPGATLHKAGERVAIAWLGKACGHCSYCVDGWETLCESQQNSGYSVDGAWAEYALAFDSHVVTVPDAVSSFDAAPLTLRRRHHVQGGQGLEAPAWRDSRGVRRRRPRAPRPSVRAELGRQGHRRRHRGHEAGPGPAARRRLRGERADDRPG